MKRLHPRLPLYLLASVMALPALPARSAEVTSPWSDHGAGFSAGTLGNSGQNLHVNRRGELEVIRRYDLDENGYLDLLFNSTHDSYAALPAALVTATRAHTLAATALGVDGSSRVVAEDLNHDGFTDLVFMPNKQNVQEQRSSIVIAWGAADGWSNSRLTRQLPVNGIASLAVGDLNGDGWPDLITVNSEGWLYGQPAGRIVRIYWGSPEGFLLNHYQDLGINGAMEVATGRFGAHGEWTAVVLAESGALHFLAKEAGREFVSVAKTLALPVGAPDGTALKPRCLLAEPGSAKGGGRLWIGTNTRTLFEVGPAATEAEIKSLDARPATHLALGRLDDDAWPDLVLTQAAARGTPGSVTVLWGAADGLDQARSTTIALPDAVAAAVADLDADGHGDLAVAIHQGSESLKASSLVFFGNGGRQLPSQGTAVETEGAQDVVVTRPGPAAPASAIFANSEHRTLDDAVPIRLYWGSAEGFSTKAMVDIPNLSGYKSSAADLNGDGYVDLVVINGGDVSDDIIARAPWAGVNIYWGGPEGSIRGPGPTRFDPARRQVLPDKHVGSINVADLNGDGFLDVVLGEFEMANRATTELVIYYGSAAGFLPENRKAVVVPGRSIGCLIADFNRDGRLDIVVGSYGTQQVITYWGGPDGYSADHKSILPYPGPIDLEAADLNGDGWLDLLVSSYEDKVAHHHDTGLTIFWGGPSGWHQSNSQWLPGMTPLGIAVADLDGDGFLDIVSPHYHSELTRERLPSYIFWGSATGFTPLNRTPLIVDSASEVVIADFNRDGKLDLAFVAHSVDAGHRSESPIFFNDGHRFQSPQVQYLPVTGPHYMWVQDIGNIYHRRNEENFTSRVFTWPEASRTGRITVEAAVRHGAQVRVKVRSAATAAALPAAPWRELAGESFETAAGDRALQYQLDLLSANGDAYPVVKKVDVTVK